MLQKQYLLAKEAFRRANRFRHSVKLQIVILLTLFAPGMLLKIYKYLRASEIELLGNFMNNL